MADTWCQGTAGASAIIAAADVNELDVGRAGQRLFAPVWRSHRCASDGGVVAKVMFSSVLTSRGRRQRVALLLGDPGLVGRGGAGIIDVQGWVVLDDLSRQVSRTTVTSTLVPRMNGWQLQTDESIVPVEQLLVGDEVSLTRLTMVPGRSEGSRAASGS